MLSYIKLELGRRRKISHLILPFVEEEELVNMSRWSSDNLRAYEVYSIDHTASLGVTTSFQREFNVSEM